MSNEIEKLLELIGDLVSGEGTWTEKRDRVLNNASENDKTNLNEFCGWFEDNDK